MNILSRVRGEYVAMAAATLPDCKSCDLETLATEIDVPELGRVRVIFKRFKSRKGKSVNWFWAVQAAFQVNNEAIQ